MKNFRGGSVSWQVLRRKEQELQEGNENNLVKIDRN